MKVFILLFLFTVVTCQAYQLSHRGLVARQGDPKSNELSSYDQLHAKYKKLAKKYIIIEVDPDPLTLLVPDDYKPDHLRAQQSDKKMSEPDVNSHTVNPAYDYPKLIPVQSRMINPLYYINPAVHTRSLIGESAQLRQVALADQEAQLAQQTKADRAARLAEIDREALSKLSEEDRNVLESRLSSSERKDLLAKLEDGQLNDLLPKGENRFGTVGFSDTVSNLGASAGGYIGGKLAGTLGAKLGAAAGAYLGAAAASRFVKKTKSVKHMVSNMVSNKKVKNVPVQYGATYGGYGAVMVQK